MVKDFCKKNYCVEMSFCIVFDKIGRMLSVCIYGIIYWMMFKCGCVKLLFVKFIYLKNFVVCMFLFFVMNISWINFKKDIIV